MFDRRHFLGGCIASACMAAPTLSFANTSATNDVEQSLRLHNIHTGEKLDLV